MSYLNDPYDYDNDNDNNNPHPLDPPAATIAAANTEKGRFIGVRFLSSHDEEILRSKGIEIIHHLGEGYFSNVWRGIYTKTTSPGTVSGNNRNICTTVYSQEIACSLYLPFSTPNNNDSDYK